MNNKEQKVEPTTEPAIVGNTVLPAVFSQDYLDWVKQVNLPPLTNTQHKFAEWLLLEENAKVISQIGDLDTIFLSVRRFVKNRS